MYAYSEIGGAKDYSERRFTSQVLLTIVHDEITERIPLVSLKEIQSGFFKVVSQ